MDGEASPICCSASLAGVFKRARISSLLTNACLTENNIPSPSLANYIVPSNSGRLTLTAGLGKLYDLQ